MSEWIKCSERMPASETPVLILMGLKYRIGEVRIEYPTYEDSYKPFPYWDDPFDDGQAWDFVDVTHWMPLPEPPQES